VKCFKYTSIAFLLFVVLWTALPKSYLHVFQNKSKAIEVIHIVNQDDCDLCNEAFYVFENPDFTFNYTNQHYTYYTNTFLFLFAPDVVKLYSHSGLSPPILT
jgi:hypothetical protein